MTQTDINRTRFEELPELLSPAEFSVAARVGRGVVYSMVREGRLATKRFGRLIRIPRTELLTHDGR